MSGAVPAPERVSFREAFWVWAKIGLLSFGGPAGQVALMHQELVEQRRWIDEGRFLHALNYCMLLPGPEATQLATYVGWLLHRTLGGVVAGTLFVLPGFVSILGLSVLYVGFRQLPAITAVFFGLKAAVLAVVVEAVLRIGRRALQGRLQVAVAALAFVAIFFFDVPFPLIVLSAALLGLAGSRAVPDAFPPAADGLKESDDSVIGRMAARGELAHTTPSVGRAVRVTAVCLALWAAPLVVLALLPDVSKVFLEEGAFFSKAAMVTFGGAYAVLAYVAQQAVDTYAWLKPGEMLDGLGLAETTPGPLIMVVQFVGFLGAYRQPGALPPMLAGVLGAALTVWVTFVPCFLWIFLGAPFIEALRGRRSLHAALSTVTAAVVGVILNLSVWFALHVAFHDVADVKWGPLRLHVPPLASVDLTAVAVSVLAMLAMFRWKLGLAKTLALCAALSVLWRLVG